MLALSSIYQPITAQPFLNDETYTEIQPCEALRPYIRCFWGTRNPLSNGASVVTKDKLVIPDTCMDIIFDIHGHNNTHDSTFVGISDTAFMTKAEDVTPAISRFAIRFYSWAVPLFSDESMRNVFNSYHRPEAYFHNFERDILDILMDNPFILDRVDKAQQYLMKRINPDQQNHNVLNAIYKILKSQGSIKMTELSGYTSVSQRQLERLFSEYVGVSPKKLSALVRYQYLWQDVLHHPYFNIQDEVFKYGYTDQSHLLNDFKKYHKMSLADARKFAHATR